MTNKFDGIEDEKLIEDFFAMAIELTNRFNRGDMAGVDEESFLEAIDEVVNLVDLD